jgi:hypothetical protein
MSQEDIDVGDRVAVRFVWHAAGQGPQAKMEFTGVAGLSE